MCLLINNLTTIDMMEKDEDRIQGRHIYHLGIYNNVKSVMGPLYMWLLPIGYYDTYKGYSFHINEEVYEERKRKRIQEKESKKLDTTIGLLLKN
jgi:hypothetical protein